MIKERMNILLVDDQPSKLLTYEAILDDLGENLIVAHSGIEALEQLLKQDVALVLMDASMPGMDGFETAEMIHQHPRFQNLPIIFVSGILVAESDRMKGYEHGAVDYVPVPVSPSVLRAKVRVFVDLHRKTKQLEVLNARITTVQEDERRRIARELHDSVGQLLTGISINNTLIESEASKVSPEAARCMAENVKMTDEVNKQIRTISYLLHPPLLDEAGLASAVRCYIEGFSNRSKVQTDLQISTNFRRLPRELELSIFRVVQECLTNVHRHSESLTAKVGITEEETFLRVEIEDAGKGIPPDKQIALKSSTESGIGLRGMSERLRLLGGTLEISSQNYGTKVTAIVPLPGKNGSETELRPESRDANAYTPDQRRIPAKRPLIES